MYIQDQRNGATAKRQQAKDKRDGTRHNRRRTFSCVVLSLSSLAFRFVCGVLSYVVVSFLILGIVRARVRVRG